MFRPFGILIIFVVIGWFAANEAVNAYQDVISDRKQGMQLAQHKISKIRDAVKTSDYEEIVQQAVILENWSKRMISLFPAGSEASVDNQSYASAEIWVDFKHFEKLIGDKQNGVASIISSAKNKNDSAIRAAVWSTLDTCNACHEKFRN